MQDVRSYPSNVLVRPDAEDATAPAHMADMIHTKWQCRDVTWRNLREVNFDMQKSSQYCMPLLVPPDA